MKYIIIIAACIFTLYFGLKYIAPAGSYCYAENYEFAVSETELINKIEEFKKNNPQYIPPQSFKDGRRDSSDYWYCMYIKLPTDDYYISFWVRGNENKKTTLGLVSANYKLENISWKNINKDFSSYENKQIKIKFEKMFLDRLELKYDKKGNSMQFLFFQL